jgi:hypothetical protein
MAHERLRGILIFEEFRKLSADNYGGPEGARCPRRKADQGCVNVSFTQKFLTAIENRVHLRERHRFALRSVNGDDEQQSCKA